MADSDSTDRDRIDEGLIELFLKCLRGQATPQEAEQYRTELLNPHSRLHDFLEDIEIAAVEMSDKTQFHTKAGDALLEVAAARRHREDVVAFLQRKCSDGTLSREQLSYLLSEGRILQIDQQSPTSGDYRRSAMQMLDAAKKVQPSLASELEAITKNRGPDIS